MRAETAESVLFDTIRAARADGGVLCGVEAGGDLRVLAAVDCPPATLASVDAPDGPVATAVRTGQPVVTTDDEAVSVARPVRLDDESTAGILLRFEREQFDGSLVVLEAFMEGAPVGLALVDDQLRFQLVNRYLARFDGEAAEAHLGRRVDEVLPRMEPDVVPLMESVLETGTAVTGVEVVDQDGRTIVASWYPVPGPDGRRRVGIVFNDVTARRRAEARLREESQIVETLHFVGRQLAGELERERVIDAVTQAATLVTAADHGAFVTLDRRVASGELPPGLPEPLLDAPLARQEVVRVGDLVAWSQRSVLAVPVTSVEGDVVGALVLSGRETDVFDPRSERLVVGIAGQASIALDNARLYQAERETRRRLALLAEAGRLLASSLEFDETLQTVARLAVPELCDVCLIDVVVEGAERLRRFVSAADGDAETVERMLEHAPSRDESHNPAVAAIEAGVSSTMQMTEDFVRRAWPDDPDYQQLVLKRFACAATVPMAGREGVIGNLSFVMRRGGRQVTDDDLSLLQDFARRVGMAVENARLFARERSVALGLQQSLLPELFPTIAGVSMASRYLPGGPDVEVGGDWYDTLPLPDGTLGMAMGDVVGRGVRAAALMGQLRSALRAYALEGHTPGECLGLLGRVLEVISDGALVTVVKTHLDPASRRLVWSNAGHPPPLILGPDGTAHFLGEAQGPPVGTLAEPRYPDVVEELEPGSLIVLYTDGLVEDRSTPLDDGLARLREAVMAGPRHDLEALCDSIIATRLGEAPVDDDVALLVVRLD